MKQFTSASWKVLTQEAKKHGKIWVLFIYLFILTFSLKFQRNYSSCEVRVCVCVYTREGCPTRQTVIRASGNRSHCWKWLIAYIISFLKEQFIGFFFLVENNTFHFLQNEEYFWGSQMSSHFNSLLLWLHPIFSLIMTSSRALPGSLLANMAVYVPMKANFTRCAKYLKIWYLNMNLLSSLK